MSYCRINPDCSIQEDAEPSDVYVIQTLNGTYECLGCGFDDKTKRLPGSFVCDRVDQMISHLLDHIKIGQDVPGHAFSRLYYELATILNNPYAYFYELNHQPENDLDE